MNRILVMLIVETEKNPGEVGLEFSELIERSDELGLTLEEMRTADITGTDFSVMSNPTLCPNS